MNLLLIGHVYTIQLLFAVLFRSISQAILTRRTGEFRNKTLRSFAHEHFSYIINLLHQGWNVAGHRHGPFAKYRVRQGYLTTVPNPGRTRVTRSTGLLEAPPVQAPVTQPNPTATPTPPTALLVYGGMFGVCGICGAYTTLATRVIIVFSHGGFSTVSYHNYHTDDYPTR